MEHGFPRSYISSTPQEILYDHERVLGGKKIVSTGTTVLRQPRLETTAYQEVSGLQDFVQVKRQESGKLVLENAFLENPYRSIASELLILGLASYIFFTSENTFMKVVAAGAGVLSLVDLFIKVPKLWTEPTTAYQAVKPSFEV